MSFFKTKDERFAAAAEAAERRSLSGQTPLSWLPEGLKKAFTDSAGRLQDSRAVNYSMGFGQGMLTGFTVLEAARGRLALAAVFLTIALGSEIYHQHRGRNLQSAKPENMLG